MTDLLIFLLRLLVLYLANYNFNSVLATGRNDIPQSQHTEEQRPQHYGPQPQSGYAIGQNQASGYPIGQNPAGGYNPIGQNSGYGAGPNPAPPPFVPPNPPLPSHPAIQPVNPGYSTNQGGYGVPAPPKSTYHQQPSHGGYGGSQTPGHDHYGAAPRVYENIYNSEDLNCDFQPHEYCRWYNGTNGVEDTFDWGIAESVIYDSWHSIPRAKDGPGDYFAFVRGDSTRARDDSAILVSDIIPCQEGAGTLRFWYWKTAVFPSLAVCKRQPPTELGTLTCFDTIRGIHRQEWIWKTVQVPADHHPFQLVFQAKFQNHHDIIGLDEIEYDAKICGYANPPAVYPVEDCGYGGCPAGEVHPPHPVEPIFPVNPINPVGPAPYVPPPPPNPLNPGSFTAVKPTSLPSPAVFPGACPQVNCDFDSSTTCAYFTGAASLGGIPQAWSVSREQTANSLTGVMKDVSGVGAYAYAGGADASKDNMFVLETPTFTVTNPARVEFSYHQAGVEGRLRVCVDSESNCPFERLGKDIKIDARRWQVNAVDIPEGQHKVPVNVDLY